MVPTGATASQGATSDPPDRPAGVGWIWSNGLRGKRGERYHSIMCSNEVGHVAEIGRAIDDLAAEAIAAYAPASRRSPAQAALTDISDADQVVIRLAELWTRLAKLDPEVARRLPTYEA